MYITFFSGTPDKRKPTRTLDRINAPVLCSPYENYSIEQPNLLISNPPPISATHFYVDDLRRYYIITDITYMSGGRCIIHGVVDSLYTYWNDIKNQTVLVSRNENRVDNTIPDNAVTLKPYKQIEIKTSGVELQRHGDCFVLGVIE